jgi:hypothetical protein
MSKREAVLSLIMTNFAVVVIVVWAWSFRKDYKHLVIAPVERMMNMLKEMALDPRQAVKKMQKKGGGNQITEMDAIEKCIGTFGKLLRVGFGEAGMGIISRNMCQSHFDPVVPGVVVQAVFGFCDIRNFTDCCEVLNEDTMIFTNNIAHIVHGLVEVKNSPIPILLNVLRQWCRRNPESRTSRTTSPAPPTHPTKHCWHSSA